MIKFIFVFILVFLVFPVYSAFSFELSQTDSEFLNSLERTVKRAETLVFEYCQMKISALAGGFTYSLPFSGNIDCNSYTGNLVIPDDYGNTYTYEYSGGRLIEIGIKNKLGVYHKKYPKDLIVVSTDGISTIKFSFRDGFLDANMPSVISNSEMLSLQKKGIKLTQNELIQALNDYYFVNISSSPKHAYFPLVNGLLAFPEARRVFIDFLLIKDKIPINSIKKINICEREMYLNFFASFAESTENEIIIPHSRYPVDFVLNLKEKTVTAKHKSEKNFVKVKLTDSGIVVTEISSNTNVSLQSLTQILKKAACESYFTRKDDHSVYALLIELIRR